MKTIYRHPLLIQEFMDYGTAKNWKSLKCSTHFFLACKKKSGDWKLSCGNDREFAFSVSTHLLEVDTHLLERNVEAVRE